MRSWQLFPDQNKLLIRKIGINFDFFERKFIFYIPTLLRLAANFSTAGKKETRMIS